MSTNHPEIWTALAAPFAKEDIKKRSQGGRELYYVTGRTVMNRLDDVLGPENWWPAYKPWKEDSVLCALTVVLPDGKVLTKEDVGADSTMTEKMKGADPGDDDKGGASDALKRAAVLFGVGRYLYGDGAPEYRKAQSSRNGHPVLERPPGPSMVHPPNHEPKERAVSVPKQWVRNAVKMANDKLQNILLIEGKGDKYEPLGNEHSVVNGVVTDWIEAGQVDKKEIAKPNGNRDPARTGALFQVAWSDNAEETKEDVWRHLHSKARKACEALGIEWGEDEPRLPEALAGTADDTFEEGRE